MRQSGLTRCNRRIDARASLSATLGHGAGIQDDNLSIARRASAFQSALQKLPF